MNAQQLLTHFDRIADAPDAIPRLRRFILDLAVRGKLTPQDPNDEPVDIFGAEGKRCKPQELHPADTPGWMVAPVGALLEFRYGKGMKASERLMEGPVPVFGSNGIVGYCETPLTEAPSIIVGRKGSAGALNLCNSPSWTTDVAYFVEAPNFFDLRYLLIGLQALDLGSLGKGVKPGLSRSDAYDLPLSIPPLAEQHRIVARVDELMALCDRLEAARAERESTRDRLAKARLARLNAPNPDPAMFHDDVTFALNNLDPLTTRPDQIKALRQTILNLAVRGKLVPQDPNDEPASELLKRVLAENEATFLKGHKRKFSIDLRSDDDAPQNIPVTWTWSSIGQLASEMRYGTSKKCEYRIKGTPVLRIPNVSRGEVDLTDLKFGALTEEERKTLLLRENDLLVVRSNGSLGIVGRAAIVTKAAESMSFAGYLVRMRFRQCYIQTRYIWLAMNSQHARDLIEKPIRSTVGLKNVNSTELAAITIPLPPLAEQRRIVAKVDELMGMCDRLEASLARDNENRGQMIDALLHEALN